ncbi:UDP-glucuronosyltransferase 2C1-like [Branchiostoma floridae x Branchiostoma japonicum]
MSRICRTRQRSIMAQNSICKPSALSRVFVIIALVVQGSQAANVAMMYDLAQSHWARFVVLGDALLSHGHNITVVAPEDILPWIHRGVSDPFNYLTFPEAGTRTYVEDYISKAWTRILEQRYMYQQTWSHVASYRQAAWRCQSLLSQGDVLDKLRQADIILGEPLTPCAAVVSSAVGVPLALLSVPMPASWLGSGVPAPTCCFPVPFSGLGRVRTFRDRVQNLAGYVATMVFGRAITAFYFDHLAKKYIGADATFVTALADTDLWLLTEHPGLDPVRPHMPNMVNIGGFMATPARPLPQELEDFMQGSDHGVIIFGLGTFVKGMPAELAEVFASAFAQLPQRVVWRYDEKEPPRGLGKNTKLMKWIPQNDLLGHPKTRLFMNHGGLNGLHEAVYHGVPMVILPLTVEHQAYVDVMVSKGMAVTLDIRAITPEDVVSAIQEVIGNSSFLCLGESRTCSSSQRRPPYSSVPDVITSPAREFDMDFELNSYKESAERLAKLFHDQPQPPLERAVWWIEHVIRHGGLPHLRTAMNDVPFYQYFHLDVLVAFVAIVTALWLPFTRIFVMKYCWQRMAVGVGISILVISIPIMFLDGL